MSIQELRKSHMMAHLLDAMDQGKDVGHYGRLAFAMVARFFLSKDEVVRYLQKNPDFGEKEARALLMEVETHDYSPPRRDRIISWQRQQDFPICPNPEDPDSCNVYNDLRFPDEVYERIGQYYEDKVEAED